MRVKLSIILMLGLPAVAAAQTTARVLGSGSLPPRQSIGLPLPQIGLPLPPIGLPLPPIGLALPPMGLPPAAAPPVRRRGVNHAVRGFGRNDPAVVYVVPANAWPLYQAAAASAGTEPQEGSSRPSKPQPPAGRLRLDIEPTGGQQQLYVDSSYAGTFKDFSGELQLEAGPHTIHIEALGYETLHVDVNIYSGVSITYRGTLNPIEPVPPTESLSTGSTSTEAIAPMTVYIVPGCYIGNVPPQDAGLPPGCDVSRVITRQQ
jgi:hypothetical protein